MKTCPYCGTEYPDDATVCSIDRQSLDPEVSRKPSRAEFLAHMAARPFEVKFGANLLVCSLIFSFVQTLVGHQWYLYHHHDSRSSSFYFLIIWIYSISSLILYCIYRGRNWARWLLLCSLIWGIVAPFILIGLFHWDYYFKWLIDAIAVVALFQRPSNEWYKGSKKILSDPAPAV